MQASASKPKTPYQLDLEVKDRKPSIVPKVGYKVKIKSWEWYETWKNGTGSIHMDTTSCVFVKDMAYLCGKVLTVQEVTGNGGCKRWRFDMDCHFWVPEFFEEVYPVQAKLCSKFPRIDFSSTLPLEGTLQAKEGELIVHDMDLRSMIEETAKKLTTYTLVQGASAKPKLKQVKTTHLIKLKKL